MLLALRSLWEATVSAIVGASKKRRRRSTVVWKPIPAVAEVVAENVIIETGDVIIANPRIVPGEVVTNNVSVFGGLIEANPQIAAGRIETAIDLFEEEWIALVLS